MSFLAFVVGVLAGSAVLVFSLLTPLGALNFLVLQWFGLRLARVYKRVPLREDLLGASLEMLGVIVRDERPHRLVPIGWSIVRWAWPLTGWWSPYRWIAKRGGLS